MPTSSREDFVNGLLEEIPGGIISRTLPYCLAG